MQGRLRRVRFVVPRLSFVLLGGFVALAVAVAVGIAAVRWAHHVAAFAEIALIVAGGLLALFLVSRHLVATWIGHRTIRELDLDEELAESRRGVHSPGAALRTNAIPPFASCWRPSSGPRATSEWLRSSPVSGARGSASLACRS